MNCECEICKNNKEFELDNDIIQAAVNEKLILFVGSGVSTEGKGVFPYSFYD